MSKFTTKNPHNKSIYFIEPNTQWIGSAEFFYKMS